MSSLHASGFISYKAIPHQFLLGQWSSEWTRYIVSSAVPLWLHTNAFHVKYAEHVQQKRDKNRKTNFKLWLHLQYCKIVLQFLTLILLIYTNLVHCTKNQFLVKTIYLFLVDMHSEYGCIWQLILLSVLPSVLGKTDIVCDCCFLSMHKTISLTKLFIALVWYAHLYNKIGYAWNTLINVIFTEDVYTTLKYFVHLFKWCDKYTYMLRNMRVAYFPGWHTYGVMQLKCAMLTLVFTVHAIIS